MKPVVTWVVLANARTIRVLAHRRTGKGLAAMARQMWHAPDVSLPNDKAGVGRSIAGPGVSAVQQTDPKEVNDWMFAKEVTDQLVKAHQSKAFDRLVLVLGPHMLGLLCANMGTALHAILLGEIPKDLSMQPIADVETHLGELLAIQTGF